jgi:hypothetical protein
LDGFAKLSEATNVTIRTTSPIVLAVFIKPPDQTSCTTHIYCSSTAL